jgi:N-acetylmuramoyl-L-alanine amidase
MDMGANLNANDAMRYMFYGQPLTNAQALHSDKEDHNYAMAQFSRKNVYQRYFALTNGRSLFARLATTLGSLIHGHSIFSSFSTVLDKLFQPLAMLPQIFSSLSPDPAFADTGANKSVPDNHHYGIVQWGFTSQEQNMIKNDPSYQPLENAYKFSQEAKDYKKKTGKDLEKVIQKKYGKCYSLDVTMGDLLSKGDIRRKNKTGDIKTGIDDGTCSPGNLDPSNNFGGEPQSVWRWRMMKRYNCVLASLKEAQDPGNKPSAGKACPAVNAVNKGTTYQPGNSDSKPTIVLDPGHAPKANEDVDKATGLPVFDYENPTEMKQMWQAANKIKAKLTKLGYKVLLTKKSLNDSSTNLKQRAVVANKAHAALGISLHTTTPIKQGGEVYYPAVGNYVTTVKGKNLTYNNKSLAAKDKKDATTMADDLSLAAKAHFKSNTYAGIYGSIERDQDGIAMKGNMLTTQYFAKVPWVYVEQYRNGGKHSVTASQLRNYVNGVVKGVVDIVPLSAGATQ